MFRERNVPRSELPPYRNAVPRCFLRHIEVEPLQLYSCQGVLLFYATYKQLTSYNYDNQENIRQDFWIWILPI